MSGTNLEPYATLGIPRGASDRQVRDAYRRLAKRHHPDLHPKGETDDRMRRINQAWEILSDPTLRARYDEGSRRAGPPSAGHWAAAPRRAPVNTTSTTWNPAPGYPSRRPTPDVDDGGRTWPWVFAAVALGMFVVIATLVGLLPFPLFGIALVILGRGVLGRFGEGR